MIVIGGTGLLAGLAGTLAWPKFSGNPGKTGAVESPPLPGGATPPAPTALTPVPASAVSAGDFKPLLNTEFLIGSPAGETKGKLVSVSQEIRQDTFKGSFVSFSVVFEAAAAIPADGITCQVTHPEMKAMEIFLSPIGDGKRKILLEASFSSRI